LWAASAARNAPETTSTTRPKSVSSLMRRTLAGQEGPAPHAAFAG
jgi:hypothetical protein